MKKTYAILMCCAALAAAAAEIDPIATRWTFGAHEPYTMYRRVGKNCTGGIDGNARWVKPWLDWFDAESPALMEELGLNFLHSRFYKGMGWEEEKKDFPNVKKFVRNCHAHGVTALAYVQFATLYPEAMKREIPQIADWSGYDYLGRHNLYGGYNGQYFRWIPCLNCREWEEYIKRMCTIALAEGGFDGIMFDNVFDEPCYCPRCEKAFREHLLKIPNSAERFGFDHLGDMLLPRVDVKTLPHLDVKDPVLQEWCRWRCDTMTALLMRLRAHIKSVKPDAIVSGNPSPYRSRSRYLHCAQNMAELCRAFDFIIMQNANFPEVRAGGVIANRVRDLKYAQDAGQRIVALCDTDTKIIHEREKNYLLPLVEDLVFGGIPTDRTIIAPSPEPGFVNRETLARRKPLLARFNAFAVSHRDALSSPSVHSVRIFYPEREVLLSEATHQGVTAAEEIFLRNRVPYGYLVSTPENPFTVPEGTEVIVTPGLVSLSDAQIEALVRYAEKGGKLVVTGDAGRYDDWNAQRFENTFLPRLKGLPNAVVRAQADLIPGADLAWRYTVSPPKDGGKALMADLARVGWTPPVRLERLPPHVFAEYRRLASGAIAVHLVNYDPAHPVAGTKLVLPPGATATFEEPFGGDSAVKPLALDGALPAFSQYALIMVK
ncbi:MAG: hypothetical protein PHR77_10120 [Kiritimatiellae bacterium]|nr:hypothetical protein [Kiritimatiellia bacterium]MDD5522605.1 hypothetical protein [Kiritimatiellia bacterium]